MPDFNRLENNINAIEPIAEGLRNETLFTIGLYFKKDFGLIGADLEEALQKINQEKCISPLPKNEVTTIAKSVDKSDIPAGKNSTANKGQRGKKTPKSKSRTVYAVSPSDTVVPVADLLRKKVNIYQNCMAKAPIGAYTIGEVLEGFKTGGRSRALIDTIRSTADKDERNKLKKELHAIVFASEPQTERKAAACIPNGILCLDFDSVPAEELDLAIAKIWEVPYVFVVGLSVSGRGIFAIVAHIVRIPLDGNECRRFS